jgi:hypothetical protein
VLAGVDQGEDLELGAIAAAVELAGVDQGEDLELGAIAAAAELAGLTRARTSSSARSRRPNSPALTMTRPGYAVVLRRR